MLPIISAEIQTMTQTGHGVMSLGDPRTVACRNVFGMLTAILKKESITKEIKLVSVTP